MMKAIWIVLPAHNEQDNIFPVIESLHKNLQGLKDKYLFSYLFVNDGSTDNTLAILEQAAQKHIDVFYLSLSKNFGHQGALLAGLTFAKGDALISMDCDMQHPPELLPKMIEEWENGNAIVYTLRQEDQKLSFWKRHTSKWFYKIINSISDVKLEAGSADFRLMDAKVVETLLKFKDNDLFLRGAVRWVGYKSTSLEFIPNARFSGETKYTFKKMLNLACKGITSQSTKPLYFSIYVGLFFVLLSLLYLPYVIYSYVLGHVMSGWSSLILSIVFFGSLQLIVLGIIGLYIAKIFTQVKNRPAFIVEKTNLQ